MPILPKTASEYLRVIVLSVSVVGAVVLGSSFANHLREGIERLYLHEGPLDLLAGGARLPAAHALQHVAALLERLRYLTVEKIANIALERLLERLRILPQVALPLRHLLRQVEELDEQALFALLGPP